MNTPSVPESETSRHRLWLAVAETAALVALFFVYAGDPPPAVNEAHYLVKAKNFWEPGFCDRDLFAASAKAHTTFYLTFGWLTRFVSLPATAWIGRFAGWSLLALGLRQCCRRFGLPAFACLGVAILWLVGIEYGNLAGEWVVGGIEAKVPAYGFVLLGIAALIARHWSRVWLWFGTAAAFHVLTGGWAVVAALVSFGVTERWRVPSGQHPARFWTAGLFVGGALSLLGLIPALRLTVDVPPEASAAAARIYTYVRIRHHLLPSDFPWHWFARHGALVLGLILVARFSVESDAEQQARQRRLVWLGLGATLIAAVGLLVGLLPAWAPDLAAKLLRYYWFRLTDTVVPLVLALWLARSFGLSAAGQSSAAGRSWRRRRRLGGALGGAAVVCFALSTTQRLWLALPPSTSHRLLGVAPQASLDQQWQSHRDWVAVCQWIRLATPSDEVLLTPRHQQTFKWYAGRAEVVNWKDVPQDARSLLEWSRRFDDVFPKRLGTVGLGAMRVPIRYSKLAEYRQRYQTRLMVVDRRIATDRLPLVKVYPVDGQSNQTYSVYELPYGQAAPPR